ncbi:hypothetical protein ACU6U9_23595 [Pseudomonas sp. HK3]|jgi:uncharacterized coiled-coil protein SlyX
MNLNTYFVAILICLPIKAIAQCSDDELNAYITQKVIEPGILPAGTQLDDTIYNAYRGNCAMEQQINNQKRLITTLNTQIATQITMSTQLDNHLEDYKEVFGDIQKIGNKQNNLIKEIVDDFDFYKRKQITQYLLPALVGLKIGYDKWQNDDSSSDLDALAYGMAGFGISLTIDQNTGLNVAGFFAKLSE